jgi:hypothetical protein
MDITPTTIILVGIVCVVLGFLASVLLNTLVDDGEAPTAEVDQTPPGGRKGGYTVVVRLWRERGSGTLVVEMDGKSMVSPGPLNEVQRERLERTARDLRAWLGMGLSGQEPVQAERAELTSLKPAQLEQADIDLSRAIGPVPDKPAPVQKPVAPTPQPASTSTSAPVSRPDSPSLAPARGVAPQPAAPKGKEELAPVAKSIAMQIEDILQDMIAGTPLAQRGIHVMEDPIRGVVVQDGLKNYEGIDAVPDPEVKGIIRSAVQEWEKGQ